MSNIKKLTVDRNLCIGAATCLALCPKVFALDAENKAVISKKGGTSGSDTTDVSELDTENIDDGALLLAAQSCPTMAISLQDELGKQVYPEV
jgi:ferredoxin